MFHVLNRGVRRLRLFDAPNDYQAFIRCVGDARRQAPMRILAYCLMPNHFHLIVWPERDGELAEFMRILTVTHAKRWHVWRGSTGTGAVYQGRYKAVAVQTDEHFVSVCRYVERNALRARLVVRAEDWPWSSLTPACRNCDTIALDPWPILRPVDWLALVNASDGLIETDRIRRAIARGRPIGSTEWTSAIASHLGLGRSLRRQGRPANRETTSGVVLRFS